MIYAGGHAETMEEGMEKAKEALRSGRALEKLAQFIEGQGGDPAVVEDYSLFPQPTTYQKVLAQESGYVTEIQARSIGLASQHSGAGREKKEDPIDLSAGIILRKKVGDAVVKGDVLAEVSGRDSLKVRQGAEEAAKAFTIGPAAPELGPIIIRIID